MDLFQSASGTPSSDGVDPEAASEADSDVGNAPGILSHASDPLSGLTQGSPPATEEPAGGGALDAPTETDAPNPPPADPSARHRITQYAIRRPDRSALWTIRSPLRTR